MDGVKVLSSRDIAELRRGLDEDGYAVLRGVVSKDRVAEFNDAILAEYERAEKFDGGGSYSGHLNCFPGEQSRFFYDEIAASGLVDEIHALRPSSTNAVRATLNFNLPKQRGPALPHRRPVHRGVRDLQRRRCRHRSRQRRDRRSPWHTSAVHQVLAVRAAAHVSLDHPPAAADAATCSSASPLCGIAACRTRATTPRAMMSLTFGESCAPEGDPFLVHDGKMFFYPNWFNTSRLGRLRERVFVAAPLTYSAYRFVKSLRGNKGYSSY